MIIQYSTEIIITKKFTKMTHKNFKIDTLHLSNNSKPILINIIIFRAIGYKINIFRQFVYYGLVMFI